MFFSSFYSLEWVLAASIIFSVPFICKSAEKFSGFSLCTRPLPALPHISSQNPHYFLFTVNTTTITTELP